MDSIRLETKELQSKMYFTQTDRLIAQTCRLRLTDSLDSQKRSTLDWSELGKLCELCEVNRISRVSLAQGIALGMVLKVTPLLLLMATRR